jgi:hypothetical protein
MSFEVQENYTSRDEGFGRLLLRAISFGSYGTGYRRRRPGRL